MRGLADLMVLWVEGWQLEVGVHRSKRVETGVMPVAAEVLAIALDSKISSLPA